MAGMPRIPPTLDTTTIRPRPACRMAGSSSLVRRIGPMRLVAMICSTTAGGISSTKPTATNAALCTTTCGAPTAAVMSLAAVTIEFGSSRSSRTAVTRGSPAAAPVAARSRFRPVSGERIAATTCHPRAYRRAAAASPRPRDAPVMTTLRSATGGSAPADGGGSVHGRALLLSAFPAIPDPGRIRARLTCRRVKALRVVDPGLWKRPGTGNGCRGPGVPDDRETAPVAEVRDVHDREHHRERAQRRVAAEPAHALRQFLRLGAAGVVAVQQQARGNHHQGNERGLPDQ